ncbi:protein of unknown function [Cupriavidus taiwanensis]|uniref:Uncharacterized protein n=1 Tax=Cupriavidus taiwanensis TaxID=164546 RepID=A0A9Q7XS77_9BURK|nr:protein of unknown function [Cupriavidus taiwanensis]
MLWTPNLYSSKVLWVKHYAHTHALAICVK